MQSRHGQRSSSGRTALASSRIQARARRGRRRTKLEKAGWALAAAALLLFGVGGGLVAYNLSFLGSAFTAEGTVTGNRQDEVWQLTGRATRYFPSLEYTDYRGAQYRLESKRGLDAPVEVGSTIPVLYVADDPDSARVKDSRFWNWPVGLLSAAVVLGLLGGAGATSRRWRRP
jgi:hypothetical protein